MNIFDTTGVDRWNALLVKHRDGKRLHTAERVELFGMIFDGIMNVLNERFDVGDAVTLRDGTPAEILERVEGLRDGPLLFRMRARGHIFLTHPFCLRPA